MGELNSPRAVSENSMSELAISNSNGDDICNIRSEDDLHIAKLIAAAPELLAVLMELKECAAYWSEYDVPLGIVDRIDCAIAKATNG